MYAVIPSGLGLLSLLLLAPRISATKYAVAASKTTLFGKFNLLPVSPAKAVAYALGGLLMMLGANLAMSSRIHHGDDIRLKALEWRNERNFYLTAVAFLSWWMLANVFDLLVRCQKQTEMIDNLRLQLELHTKKGTGVETGRKQNMSESSAIHVTKPTSPVATRLTKPPLDRQQSGIHVEIAPSVDKDHLPVPVARIEDAGTMKMAHDIGLPQPEITLSPLPPVPVAGTITVPLPVAAPISPRRHSFPSSHATAAQGQKKDEKSEEKPSVLVGEKTIPLVPRPESPEVDQPEHYVAGHADEKGILPSLPPLDTKTMHEEQWGAWGPVDAAAFKVRGKTYLKDRVKIPAVSNLFSLVSVELGTSTQAITYMSTRPDSYITKLHAAQHFSASNPPPFFLVVNFITPSVPPVNLAIYLQAPSFVKGYYADSYKALAQKTNGPLPQPSEAGGKETGNDQAQQGNDEDAKKPENVALMKLLDEFLAKDDAFRTSCFKFIPRVVEGSWIVKRSVGQQPVILGNKLKQNYHFDATLNYMEVDVDVSSSRVGAAMWKLTHGFASSLIIDLSVLLEGHSSEELPERLLGGVRLSHLDMTKLPQFKA